MAFLVVRVAHDHMRRRAGRHLAGSEVREMRARVTLAFGCIKVCTLIHHATKYGVCEHSMLLLQRENS